MTTKHSILFTYDIDIKKLFIYLILKVILFVKIINTVFKKAHIVYEIKIKKKKNCCYHLIQKKRVDNENKKGI